jgi:hypothetical protein
MWDELFNSHAIFPPKWFGRWETITMTFEYEDPGDDYELIEEEGESFVVAYVGSDIDTGCAYYAVAALSPLYDYFEYSFFVIERCSGSEEQFNSGLKTNGLFNEVDRSAILTVVLRATEMLLDWKQPLLVDRCTFDANLPKKALVKHTLISKIFSGCGYKITSCDDWNGKRVWRAERVAEGLFDE